MSPARRAEAAELLRQHQWRGYDDVCVCGASQNVAVEPDVWLAGHQLDVLAAAGFELFRVPSSP